MSIVMAGNVLDDRIDLKNCKKVETSVGNRFRRKCDPTLGDLLVVSRGATIGRLCVVGTSEPFCLMGSVILVRPRKEVMDSQFLRAFLKHPVTQRVLYNTSGSSAQQAMYLKDLKRLVSYVPPVAIQREFARRVAALENLKTAHRASLAELDTLFSALQYRAFRGEL
jgi:type I restriction enzyme, S subunit